MALRATVPSSAFVTLPGLTKVHNPPASYAPASGEASESFGFPAAATLSSASLAVAAALGTSMTLAHRRHSSQAAGAKVRAATVTRAFEDELGVQAPVGFWDPMGLSKDGNVDDFRRRREAELKNGRVSMFATIGYITPEYYKLPGYLSPSQGLKFADVPNGLAAINKVPVEGWLQWVALCGFYEMCVNVPVDPAEPGNYGKGSLGLTGDSIPDPVIRKRRLNSEIANGRLAMLAILGMMVQNGITGTTGPEMWLGRFAAEKDVTTATKEDSPSLDTFSAKGNITPAGEKGAVAAPAGGEASVTKGVTTEAPIMVNGRPLPREMIGTGGPMPNDYWDPAGLAIGKTEDQLRHWRAVELKHGRVCMLACLGWFHVAAGWHPVGDAAARMRVSDDPLINVTQLPIAGAFQVVFTLLCVEWLTTYVCKPPEKKPWDVLGWDPVIRKEDDPEWMKSQLQELNNGRLAMFGILGLIMTDAATGDYGAWIAQPCFGNRICDDYLSWKGVFPPAPYMPEPLYPPTPPLF